MREKIEAAIAKWTSRLKVAVPNRLWWRKKFKKQETSGVIPESILKLEDVGRPAPESKPDEAWVNRATAPPEIRDPSLYREHGIQTTKLVVGQDVFMGKDFYPFWLCSNKGKVVKVTPEGAEVQTADDLIRFDTNGRELDTSRRDRLGFEPSPDDTFHTSLWQTAPEFGPWNLMELYFVLYQVTGSVTRSQSTFLKHGDGSIQRFDTLQEAEKVAKELNKTMNSGITSTCISYQAVSQIDLEHCNVCTNDFSSQPPQLQGLVLEICRLACSLPTFPVPVFRPDFKRIKTPKAPNGHSAACAFSLRDSGSGDLIEITDEKLLEKLRSIKGQYSYAGPYALFYYEYLMSTADSKVQVHVNKR